MNELAKKLSEMYRNGSANGEAMPQVVLFGIGMDHHTADLICIAV